MKIIRMIQDVMVVIGVITAVTLVDGSEKSGTNAWAAFVIASFAVLTIIDRECRMDKYGK